MLFYSGVLLSILVFWHDECENGGLLSKNTIQEILFTIHINICEYICDNCHLIQILNALYGFWEKNNKCDTISL